MRSCLNQPACPSNSIICSSMSLASQRAFPFLQSLKIHIWIPTAMPYPAPHKIHAALNVKTPCARSRHEQQVPQVHSPIPGSSRSSESSRKIQSPCMGIVSSAQFDLLLTRSPSFKFIPVYFCPVAFCNFQVLYPCCPNQSQSLRHSTI